VAIPLLAAVVQWLASASAAGVVGNRADAAVMRLATGPGFKDRIAELASDTSGVDIDQAAFGEWLTDQRTVDLLARLAARPEISGDADLQEIAGLYADELVVTAEEFGIVSDSGTGSTQRAQLEELIACTLLALWTETDLSLRPLFVLLGDTTTLLEGQEQLRELVENLADHVAARDRALAAPGPADLAALRARYLGEMRAFLARAPRWHPGELHTLFLDRRVNPVMVGRPTGRSRFGTVSWRSAVANVRLAAVVAPAGLGKTWALRASLAEAAADPAGGLPVWAHAQTLATVWDQAVPMPEMIGRLAALATRSLPPTDTSLLVSEALARMGVVLAIDALDEVHEPGLRVRAEAALAAIGEALRSGEFRGQLIFSSRPAGFDNPVPGFGRARDGSEVLVELIPFELAEVEALFDRWCELRGSDRSRPRLRDLTRPGSPLRQAVTVPLLASLCAWVAETDDVAVTKAGVYGQVVNRFLERRWKQAEEQSPLGQHADDPAWRDLVRSALGHLALAMADSDTGWQEQASPVWCEGVLERARCPDPPPSRSRTWMMCFHVGALTPIGLTGDALDVPLGWIHRSIQQFLVADRLATDPGAAGVLASKCESPEWGDVAIFLAGRLPGSEPGAALLQALCERAIHGGDPFGLLSELIAAVAVELPREAMPPEGRRHLLTQLAAGVAGPSALVPVLQDDALGALDALIQAGHFDPDIYEALLCLGRKGEEVLVDLAATQAGADGAISALAESDPDAAVRALLRRAESGIGISSRDARVLRQADDELRGKMLDAYRREPSNPGRADLAAAAGAAGTLDAFTGNLSDPDRRCRLGALNGIATLLSFDVPREVAAQVRRLVDDDPDPGVRRLAANIIQTWEIGTPAVLQTRQSAPENNASELDAETLLVSLLTSGDSTRIATALQLCANDPALLTIPRVATLVAVFEQRVHDGEFDWRWVDSLVRLRPQLAAVLVDHVRTGTTSAIRNAALAVPYLDSVPVRDRLDALACALGRVDERWSAASFDVLADSHPTLAIESICQALQSQHYTGPAGVRRLVSAGRRALDLLVPAQRNLLMPRIAAATAIVTPAWTSAPPLPPNS